MGKIDRVAQRAGRVSPGQNLQEKGGVLHSWTGDQSLGLHDTEPSDTPQNLLSHVPSLFNQGLKDNWWGNGVVSGGCLWLKRAAGGVPEGICLTKQMDFVVTFYFFFSK